MKRVIAFIILLLSFVILLHTSTEAQKYKPHYLYKWEDAKVQRLTCNLSSDEVKGFFIDENDRLFLIYREVCFDTLNWMYRDTLFLMTKEKGEEWSKPEIIGNPSLGIYYAKYVGYDPSTGLIHLFYDCAHSLHCGDTLYYTNSSMSNWEIVKTDSGADRVHVGAMEFDTLGNIHLIWNVNFDSLTQHWYKVMYANNSTGEWIEQQATPPIFIEPYEGGGTSYLAVQKNGRAHIVYHGDAPDFQYYYATNDSLKSQDWHPDTIPRPSRPIYNYAGGPLKVDCNDIIHLLTWGCIQEGYCIGDELHRTFYYYKQSQDTIWQGADLILDSLFYPAELYIDRESIPYLLEWDPSTYCWFFTDRRQGFWQEPYHVFDTTSMCNDLSSIYVTQPFFVLDSEGHGHAVFSGCLFQFMAQDDSLEIYYYGSPFTSVEETTSGEQGILSFKLFQNYPNPFNSVTSIRYTVNSRQSQPIPTTLKIYNILGKEVRELVNKKQSPGNYTITWDGRNNQGKEVSSGIYFYVLSAGESKEERKMLFIK
jgi:hypothetical protein